MMELCSATILLYIYRDGAMMEDKVRKFEGINAQLSKAISYFWRTRAHQLNRQKTFSYYNEPAASAPVTSSERLKGFINLITELLLEAGVNKQYIYYKKDLEIPGFFRPYKEWDLLVIKDYRLILALQVKFHVGLTFGNLFNTRIEEAVGVAQDFWIAYREGSYGKTVKPWLGYILLLEDCPATRAQNRVKEPHFKVSPEFMNASFVKRYELFCRRLVSEGFYTAAVYILSDKREGLRGHYTEPAEDLSFDMFVQSLVTQATNYKSIDTME
jgi:hypothetical protein